MLRQLLDESEWPLQLILFTAKPNDGMVVSLDTQNQVMEYLEKAISRSIKGRDYTFRYSSTQRMILLTDSGGMGAKSVSGHIMKEFYRLYDKKEINITYSTIDIS